jgi:probable F420-dependent oxidoreductase
VRPFRFGLQATSDDPRDVIRFAQAAEAAGFDVFQMGDHLGASCSPLAALAAASLATSTIRVGTLVLNNDLRHPLTLAQELATIDRLSGGRLEVGLGAGHSFTEYAAAGIDFDSAAARKERLAEAVQILRALFGGDPVTWTGARYRLDRALTLTPVQQPVPLLVGVNGRAALAHAARHADIIGLTMFGRTLEDGQRHEVRWEASRLDDTVAWIRTNAGERWPALELHALVQAVVVTNDRLTAADAIAARTGMDPTDILSTPFVCIGTHEEMKEHLETCRRRWGISYFSVRDLDSFAPVVALMK